MSLFPSSSFLTTNGLCEYSQQIHPPPFFPTRPMAQSALQCGRWVRQLRENPEVCSSRWGGRLLLGGWGWAWGVALYKLRGRTNTFSNSSARPRSSSLLQVRLFQSSRRARAAHLDSLPCASDSGNGLQHSCWVWHMTLVDLRDCRL